MRRAGTFAVAALSATALAAAPAAQASDQGLVKTVARGELLAGERRQRIGVGRFGDGFSVPLRIKAFMVPPSPKRCGATHVSAPLDASQAV